MPQMGYDMHEGTLVRWLKSEDSEVTLGEPIAEIETDKAVVEVEATAAGLLRKILAAEGATVPVGEPIAIIGEAGEDIAGLLGAEPAADVADAAEEPASEPTPEVAEAHEEPTGIPLPPPAGEAAQPAAEAPEEDHDLRASPVARRLAAERGIDLSLITGTGPGNRITRDDVLWYKPPEETYDEPEAADEEPAEPVMETEAADEEPAEPAMEAEAADEEPAEPAMEAEAADEEPTEPAMEAEAADEEPSEPAMETEAADEEPTEPAMEAEAADEEPAETAMETEAADEEPAEPVMETEAADEEPAETVMEAEAAGEEPAETAMEAEAADEEPVEPAMEDEEPAMEDEAEAEEPTEPEMEATDDEPAEPEAAPQEEAPSNVIPLSRTRRQIARVTSRSKQEIPHFYVSAEIDMTQAMEMRRQLNGRLDDDSRVSVNDLVVKASVDALVEFPNFNASYSDDGIVLHDSVNVGLAIAQDDGLIVPALLDCAGKSLVELAAASKDLARRAGSGALQAEEYAGATFAISNMGMFGVSSFVAIIQPPQSAILAVGAVATQAVIRDDEIVAADMITATLSADHRVVDGADGARFIGEIKRILESPFTLLL